MPPPGGKTPGAAPPPWRTPPVGKTPGAAPQPWRTPPGGKTPDAAQASSSEDPKEEKRVKFEQVAGQKRALGAEIDDDEQNAGQKRALGAAACKSAMAKRQAAWLLEDHVRIWRCFIIWWPDPRR